MKRPYWVITRRFAKNAVYLFIYFRLTLFISRPTFCHSNEERGSEINAAPLGNNNNNKKNAV